MIEFHHFKIYYAYMLVCYLWKHIYYVPFFFFGSDFSGSNYQYSVHVNDIEKSPQFCLVLCVKLVIVVQIDASINLFHFCIEKRKLHLELVLSTAHVS